MEQRQEPVFVCGKDFMVATLLRRSLHTPELVIIWALEALNYAVHVLLRPEPWNSTSVTIGYALWALQLWCFARLQLCDPGTVSSEWETSAKAGAELSTVCPRTGRLVPMRAGYVRNANAVVLGLDHYCYWLGTPVGLYNRKLFILFTGYSAVFCIMGAAHSSYELLWGTPARFGLPSFFTALRVSRELHVDDPLTLAALGSSARDLVEAGCRWGFAMWSHARAASEHAGSLSYYVCLALSVPLNTVAAILLAALTAHQLLLVLFNRTTLAPRDARFDLGFKDNWRQVFGHDVRFWLLPLVGSGPGADGDRLQRNPTSCHCTLP